MTTTNKLTVAALGLLIAIGGLAVNAAAKNGDSDTACEDMPNLWSAAVEINYDRQARTVTFVWEDGQTATLHDTDPGCDSQPGLQAELQGNRNHYLANEKVSCQDLRDLVDAVKAERKAEGKSTKGRVSVSDAAAEKAARKNPKNAPLADSGKVREKNHAGGAPHNRPRRIRRGARQMPQVKRLVATAALVAAVAVVGCSGNDGAEVGTTTTTAIEDKRSPSACDFRAGDPITAEDVEVPCVKTFDCADGRVYVEADLGGGKGLEGFAPTDQSGNPRSDTTDAVWRERGPLYQDTGRTKLSFDCGG